MQIKVSINIFMCFSPFCILLKLIDSICTSYSLKSNAAVDKLNDEIKVSQLHIDRWWDNFIWYFYLFGLLFPLYFIWLICAKRYFKYAFANNICSWNMADNNRYVIWMNAFLILLDIHFVSYIFPGIIWFIFKFSIKTNRCLFRIIYLFKIMIINNECKT